MVKVEFGKLAQKLIERIEEPTKLEKNLVKANIGLALVLDAEDAGDTYRICVVRTISNSLYPRLIHVMSIFNLV